MNFIKWEIGLERKPEVTRMARRLGLSAFDTAGRLMAVWGWAYGLTKNGVIRNAGSDEVDTVVMRNGFAEAMAAEGWLSVTDHGLAFPKWGRHFRQVKKQQEDNRERQRRYRARHQANRNAVTNAPRNAVSNGVSNALLTPQEKIREEEEKREEEKITSPPPPSPTPSVVMTAGAAADPMLGTRVDALSPAENQPKPKTMTVMGRKVPALALVTDPCPHDPDVLLDSALVPDDLFPMIQAFKHRGYINPLELEQFGDRIKRYGLPLVRKALDIAIAANVDKMPYLDAVLRNGCREENTAVRQRDETTQHLNTLIARGQLKTVRLE